MAKRALLRPKSVVKPNPFALMSVIKAKSQRRSNDLGVHVTPEMVDETVVRAVDGRQVHWFVTDRDAAIATQVDAT